MANGLLFFYIFWILWIMITFFMPKTKERTVLAVFILLCLCFANSYINLSIPVSITYVILLTGLAFLQSKQSRVVYHFFCTFTISIGSSAMLLWEANTTIWLVTSREILIPLAMVAISFFLTNGFYSRLTCSLFGLCIGDFMFKTILYFFSFKEIIGDKAFLDIASVTVMLNVVIAIVTLLSEKVRLYTTHLTSNNP